jgi:hypothetical protein
MSKSKDTLEALEAHVLVNTYLPGTHGIGGCVGPIAGLETAVEKKKFLPLLGIEPRSSSPYYVMQHINECHGTELTLSLYLDGK